MAQKRYGDKFILVKLEPNYGVDSGPIGGDAVRAMNLVRASYEGSRVERTYDRKSMAASRSWNTSPYVQLTFDVELGAGAGAAQAPVYAALLRACGLEESDRAAEVAADHADGTDYVVGDLVSLANLNYECIQAHTSDAGTNDPGTAGGAAFWSLRNYIFPAAKVYKPRDTAHESVSIHYHAAGDRQVILGCRGSVVWTLARGEIPKMSFTLMGRYERPSTQVQPVADISDYPVPYPITNRNTPDWVLHNVDNQFLSSLNITLGNSVVWRDLVNDAQVPHHRSQGQLGCRGGGRGNCRHGLPRAHGEPFGSAAPWRSSFASWPSCEQANRVLLDWSSTGHHDGHQLR